MLALLLLLLLSVTTLVTLVPPPTAPARACRQCCDDLELLEGSGFQPAAAELSRVPEVRTYINMTILKGRLLSGLWRKVEGEGGSRASPPSVRLQ